MWQPRLEFPIGKVVYPDAVWYTYVDRDDIDEIIDRHVVGGAAGKAGASPAAYAHRSPATRADAHPRSSC